MSDHHDDILRKKFAQFLKTLRESRGDSQPIAAERTGLSQQNISNWESGTYDPKVLAYAKYCSAYGIDLYSLLERAYNARQSHKPMVETDASPVLAQVLDDLQHEADAVLPVLLAFDSLGAFAGPEEAARKRVFLLWHSVRDILSQVK